MSRSDNTPARRRPAATERVGGVRWRRRDVVVGAIAATGASACASVEAPDDVESRLRNDIRRYVQFGVHRSGTRGEAATASWMAERLRALGYQTTLDAFSVRTIANPAASVRVGARAFEAFPQWRSKMAEGRDTLSGALVRLGDAQASPRAIAIAAEPAPLSAYWTAAHDAFVDRAHAAGAAALVMAIDDRTGGLFVCNRESAAPDFPLPVALVSLATLRDLLSLATQGATAHVQCGGTPVTARSFNVIARKDGIGKAIVVSTPLTGWFQCGAERGPGIALTLQLADRLGAARRPVVVIGTGSHEIGHLGMTRAVVNSAPPPEDTALWLHLGAGIAARALDDRFGVTSPQWVISTPSATTLAKGLTDTHGFTPLPGRADAPGEGGQVIKHGHERVVALAGAFPGFHTPGDDGRAVDTVSLTRVLVALESLVESAEG